jgi:hypothetical protein
MRPLVVGLVSTAVLASGCGGSSSKGAKAGSSFAASSTTAAAVTTTTRLQAATATKGDAFCAAAAKAAATEATVDLDHGSPVALKASVGATVASVKVAQKLAPKDAEQIVTNFAKFLHDVQVLLVAHHYDVAAFNASKEWKAMMNDPALARIFPDLDGYLKTKCA